jgi:hypothetical protein
VVESSVKFDILRAATRCVGFRVFRNGRRALQPNTILSSAEAKASVPTGAKTDTLVAESVSSPRLCGTGALAFSGVI